MKQLVRIFLITVFIVNPLFSQRLVDKREELTENTGLSKTSDAKDRAQNVININQLGQVVTNMGQWHPYTGVFPRGRWPINSNHDQIWKMSFLLVFLITLHMQGKWNKRMGSFGGES